ncbi:hypothetical protein IW140_002794 [Coemansia sp. RSA 1813]|nr:hypothetical protein IW140_002794 [Coemansia sp. RSA 1813]
MLLVSRKDALRDLAECAQNGDLVRAYQILRLLRHRHALRSSSGKQTNCVIHDTEVALALVQVIKAVHIWEDCLPCLNMILEMRKDLLGERRVDDPYTIIGDVDTKVLVPVLEAILSPHFAIMPSRNLAGFTAQQILSDYNSVLNISEHRSIAIRATGFASDIQRLLSLEKMLPKDSLNKTDRFELVLAYARCLRPYTALRMVPSLGELSKEQNVELHVAICISLAETANIEDALKHYEALSPDSELWMGLHSNSAFDCTVTPLQTAVAMAYSSSLCTLPRSPFTENLHSIASTHCTPPSNPGYSKTVLNFYQKTVAALRKQVSKAAWKKLSINRSLFLADCMVYAMTSKIDILHANAKTSKLVTKFHTLRQDFVKSLQLKHSDKAAYGQAAQAQTSLLVSAPLRHLLWAMLFSPCSLRHVRKVVQWELEHTKQLVPSFEPSVADLEPAFLAFLPDSFRAVSAMGNFANNSAFMLSERLLFFLDLSSVYPYASQLLAMAKKAWVMESTDHRLFPLYIWMLRVQGKNKQTMSVLDFAITVPPVSILPGSLALVNTRNQVFYERIFSLASTYRDGSDFGISQLRSMIQNKGNPVCLTNRLALTILYCCERSKNFPAALDTINALHVKDIRSLAPCIQELFMRVCFVTGQVSKAMPIFHHLNYGAKDTRISDSAFSLIIRYMGNIRGSLVGAEHAFDAWFQIMDYQGNVTPALADKWNEIRMTAEARTTANAFLPRNEYLPEVLEKIQIVRGKRGKTSAEKFIRIGEFNMVVALVGAYVGAGKYVMASLWEVWLLDAIKSRAIQLHPGHVAVMEHVQRYHLYRESQDGVHACLDYMIAIDFGVPEGILGSEMYFLNQKNVLLALANCIRDDTSGQLAFMVRSYLEQHKIKRLWNAINHLVHDNKAMDDPKEFLRRWSAGTEDISRAK